MRVSELAKELGISSDEILGKLKALKLKAKDSKQDLNEAVIPILRREFKGAAKPAKVVEEKSKIVPSRPRAARPWETKEIKLKESPKNSAAVKSKAAKLAPNAKDLTKGPVSKKAKSVPVNPAKVTAAIEVPRIEKSSKSAKVSGQKSEVKVVKPQSVSAPVGPDKSDKPALKPTSAVSQPAKLHPPKTLAKPLIKPSVPGAKQPQRLPDPRPVPQTQTTAAIQPPAPPQGEKVAIELPLPISVKDLSVRFQQKPSVILKSLMEKRILAHINLLLSEETVRKIAPEFGFEISKLKTQEEQMIKSHRAQDDDPKLLKPRSPVVTFMGHVDHGKTSLLDKIRKSRVADEEHGGITQHIGAYSVPYKTGRITFLDTPGHEAFTAMRSRGAHITDLVVLVVAADEGIMPQTEEAINHARAAEVPIIVALNKIDKKNADPDRVKKQLIEKELTPEDWGGKTICVGVSASTGQGIDQLLEMILLESEMLELKANPDRKATGVVVEAHLSGGRGSLATVIVQNGTLREGDIVITGPYFGRIKAMFDDHERSIKVAGPAMPVEILGLPAVPEAGESFYVVETEKQAKEITEKRAEQIKIQRLEQTAGKLTLEDLYAQIQEGKIKSLSLILKADVQGSLEALKASLEKIPSDQIQLKFIHTGVGDVNTSDAILAAASNAIIIAFQVEINVRAKDEIEKQSIDVRTYRIIYDAVNDITNALEGLLEPRMRKKFVGRVDIRQVFKLSKGIIAGCYVSKGKIHRKVSVDVMRNGQVVFSGKLSSLKRFKDDVREVTEGYECGLTVEGFDAIEVGDVVEAYDLESIARKLITAAV